MERKRTRWWLPLIMILAGVTVVVGIPGYCLWWALTAKPNVAVDYRDRIDALQDSRWPRAPMTQDAWPLLVEACGLLDRVGYEVVLAPGAALHPDADFAQLYDVRIPERRQDLQLDRELARLPELLHDRPDLALVCETPERDIDPGEVQRAWACYRRLEEAGLFDLLARIAACPDARRPRQDGIHVGWLLPEVGPARRMGFLGIARMRLARDQEDTAELVAAIEANLALARHISRQFSVIDWLIASGIASRTLDEVRSLLADGGFTAPACRAVLGALDRHLDVASIAHPLDCERLLVHDAIQRLHTDDGNGDGRLIVSLLPELDLGAPALDGMERLTNLTTWRHASRAETVARTDEYYDQMIRFARTPWHELEPGEHRRFAADFTDALGERYRVLATLRLAAERLVESDASLRMHEAGTRVMLAIELHRALHGTCPATLAEIDAAPVPDNPVTGQPFEYERLPDGRYELRSPQDPATGEPRSFQVARDAVNSPSRKPDRPRRHGDTEVHGGEGMAAVGRAACHLGPHS